MKVSTLLVSTFLALASGHYVDEEVPKARNDNIPRNKGELHAHERSHYPEETRAQAPPRTHETRSDPAGPRVHSKQTNLRNGVPRHHQPRNTIEVDVVVIGSGMAGLNAAHDLKKDGFSVKILEAKSRHGGRIYKNDSTFGIPIDIGAEWVHIEAKTVGDGEYAGPSDLLRAITGTNPPYSFVAPPPNLYVWSPEENERDTNSDSKDYRWNDATWYDFMKTQIIDDEDLEQDIMLNCPVNHIWYGDSWADGVEVYYTQGGVDKTIIANAVVVTIPMNMVQESLKDGGNRLEGAITFEDSGGEYGLPDAYHTEAAKYKMGPALKVWLEFDRTFYYKLQALLSVENNHNVNGQEASTNWGQRLYFDEMHGHPADAAHKHVIGMFAHGTGTAGAFASMSNTEIVNFVLDELTRIYGQNVRDYYEDNYFIQHWTKEPYINTGYTQYAPWSAMDQFSKPINQVIYFAGEAIPPDFEDWGYAHGAAQSGKKAAQKIYNNSPDRRRKLRTA